MVTIDKKVIDAVKSSVEEIIADLTDRAGLDAEWGHIDASTKAEIKKSWRNIILQELKRCD